MCLDIINRRNRPLRSLHLAKKVFEGGFYTNRLSAQYKSGRYDVGGLYRDKKKKFIARAYRTGYHAYTSNTQGNARASNSEVEKYVLLTNITATGDQNSTKAIVGRAMYILTDEEAETVQLGKPIPKALREKFWKLYNESKPKKVFGHFYKA